MKWPYNSPGIPDELFIRGSVPITKAEIRAVSLSKLKLFEECDLLDIGCGTGSVTVEAAMRCRKGSVTGADSNPEAVELTKRNALAFGLENVGVISGAAPGCLPGRLYDRIFIGGGGKGLEEIIAYCRNHLKPGGIVVANTILLESTYCALKTLEKQGFKNMECTCLNIAKGIKEENWMMRALNPIYVISGEIG